METCHVCGGDLSPRFSGLTDRLSGKSFDVLECGSCRLGHTTPLLEDVSQFYADYYGGRHGFTNGFCARRRLRWLRRSSPPGRVLDIGCGDGTFLRFAAAAGWETAGTELDASRLAGSNIDVRADLDEILAAYGAGSFDAVTMWHTLEHFTDPRAMLLKAAAALKPGGALIVAVPNFDGAQSRIFGRSWLHLDVPHHLFHFGPEALGELLADCGFSVEWRRDQEFEYDLLGWSQSALNAMFEEPNVFFRTLTGHARRVSAFVRARDFALGTVFTGAALPFLAATTLAGRGGTLVIGARKLDNSAGAT